MGDTVTACQSCGAPVRFVPSQATGRTMILDRDPVDHGNVTLEGNLLGEQVAVVHPGPAPVDPDRRYLSHHATCPDAARWRS